MKNKQLEAKSRLTNLVCQTKMAMATKDVWLVATLLRQMRQLVAKIVGEAKKRLLLGEPPINIRHSPNFTRGVLKRLLTPPKNMRRLMLSTVTGGALLAASVGAMPVRADNITVTAGAGDVVDANGGVCVGLTIADLPGPDGKISLREAICAANTNAGVDTITLPSDTIALTTVGTNENQAARGDLDVITGTHVIINGAGSSNTIIDGNATDRVFSVLPGGTLELSKVTVQNGNTTGNGAGLYNYNATLIVSESVITGNTILSPLGGGGIANYAYNSQSHTSIISSTISGNSAGVGGGIYNFSNDPATNTSTALLTVTHSTISNNRATGSGAIREKGGGGISNFSYYGTAQTSLLSSTVSGNQTVEKGGGIFNAAYYGYYADLILTNSTVSSNTATSSGGGIASFNYGGNDTAVYLTNSLVVSNTSGSDGGGIYNAAYYGRSAYLASTNSTIASNTATGPGGGIANYNYGGLQSKAVIKNSTISGNTTGAQGGGIYNAVNYGPYANLNLTNSTVANNTATHAGGGIANYNYDGTRAIAIIEDSTISGNATDTHGGGIYNGSYKGYASPMGLSNSTVSGNHSKLNGGGVYTVAENTSIAGLGIFNTTITDNQADSDNNSTGNGGGLFIGNKAGYEHTIISNTIIAGNSANAHPDGSGIVIADTHNLINDTTGLTASFNNSITNTNPLLGPLANNGGTNTASGEPPFTHALLSGSPAISAANNTVCADAPINNLDQRGQPRPGGDSTICDIGAYEYQGASVTLYLPMIFKDHTMFADLVIDSLTATSSGVTVIIRNAGTATITNDFWLDVYFNPSETPSLNKVWDTIASNGAVWGVTKSLAPGESLILTVGDTYYRADKSSGSFPSGQNVYAFVDSVNHDTSYGNVLESNEGNNLAGPVTSITPTELPSVISTQSNSQDELPERE